MLLQTEGLTKIFGGLVALSELSFHIARGEILGLIGPNGAGKTTLFSVITGTHKPTKGKVIFQGSDITSLKSHQIASAGLVKTFQLTRLFNQVTVMDHVATGQHCKKKSLVWGALTRNRPTLKEDEESREKAIEILRLTNLIQVADKYAKDITNSQQRCLMIATALAAEPKLLLLDEPTAGMSSEETDEVVELIKIIRNKGISVFLIEHNMKVAMTISDRILAISYGQKITEGLPREVANCKEVIEAYLGEELEC